MNYLFLVLVAFIVPVLLHKSHGNQNLHAKIEEAFFFLKLFIYFVPVDGQLLAFTVEYLLNGYPK